MFEPLRKRIAEWLYPINVIELTRKQLALVDSKSALYEELDKEQQDKLAAEALSVYQNPSFLQILHYLMRDQERFTTCEAGSWDSVLIGRGTVNGISLIEEEFKKLASIQEDAMRIEKFNQHDLT